MHVLCAYHTSVCGRVFECAKTKKDAFTVNEKFLGAISVDNGIIV